MFTLVELVLKIYKLLRVKKHYYLFICRNSLICFKHIPVNLNIIGSVDKLLGGSSASRDATNTLGKTCETQAINVTLPVKL